MADFDALATAVAKQPDLEQKLSALLVGLSERIKATSNDQNIHKLSRDLQAAVPDLLKAMTAPNH